MKKVFFSLILILIAVLFNSCEIKTGTRLKLNWDQHSYEIRSSSPMWYKLSYFDGEKVVDCIVDSGIQKTEIDILGAYFYPIVLVPLDELSPLGGFYEKGGKKTVFLKQEDGAFAKLILDVARYEPDIIKNFSFAWFKENNINIQTIDQEAFLESLLKGTISKKSIKTCKAFKLLLSSLPSGEYLSDNPKIENINIRSIGDEMPISVFPGVYHLWEWKRDILFTFIITEKGEVQTSLGNLRPLFDKY